MAGAATEHFVDGKGLPFQYSGEQYFTEVPYSSGFRTDIAVTRINPWDAARRRMYIGHLTPLPDERKYRRSYRTISRRGPFTRRQWIKEDATYSSEQTSREVWDWMDEHGYLAPVSAEGAGGGQARLPIDIDLHPQAETIPTSDTPAVAVHYPDSLSITAFELKPRDWRQALRQALRAECYADYRFVVLDGAVAEEAYEDARKEFSNSGVGLISLARDSADILHPPKQVSPPMSTTRHMLNERSLTNIPKNVEADIDKKHAELDSASN